MLLIKTTLKESPINGIGIYASEYIPKGTIIWRFSYLIDSYIREADIEDMTELEKEFILKYAYKEKGVHVLCVDNARFMNHSDDANTYETKSETIAKTDIEIGEEITCNYNEFCENGLGFISD